MTASRSPQPALSLGDAIAIIIGVVIGAGIFETPALVASNTPNPTVMILVWVLGGLISLVGALCYAELATTYPHAGGTYHYLMRAFGRPIAFLFGWARMTVIQTGSIALLAFVFGDYASQIVTLGPYSSSIYAAGAIVIFTVLNLIHVQQGKWTQNILSTAKVLGLVVIVMVGLFWGTTAGEATASASSTTSSGSIGLAMVFVLLSYGGWNEAAYISAELQNVGRNMIRSLLLSIGLIGGIYVLINVAYLQGLGLAGMAQSDAVAAELLRQVVGAPAAGIISVLIAITALGSINATIFTGARTNYALGQDFRLFSILGRWHLQAGTPKTALWVQGVIALGLVLLGSLQRKGFQTMVDYTAPIFWFFFLLSGIALFILRYREPHRSRPYQVPFYPLTPILFCCSCGYLVYSSLAYTGFGALVGVGVVMAGLPFLAWMEKRP
jgi:amino acid transporter